MPNFKLSEFKRVEWSSKKEEHDTFYGDCEQADISGWNEAREEVLSTKVGLDVKKIYQIMGLVYTFDKHKHKELDSELMIDLAQALENRLPEILTSEEAEDGHK